MTKLCGIYLLTHIETGRKYVGQSVDINKRWQVHARGRSDTHLGRAISIYGWHSFSKEVISICEKDQLNDSESKFVLLHGCMSPNGFNLTTGGGQFELSKESKEKMSAVRTGKKFTDQTKSNMKAAQNNRSAEWAEKIAKCGIGRVASAETRKKIGAASALRSHTAESKEKMSASQMGRVVSDITRAKLSAALTGREFSKETLERMSASHKGFKHSEESIRKISLVSQNMSAETRAKISSSNMGKKHSEESKAKIAASNTGQKHTPERRAKITAVKAANRLLRQNAAIASASGLSSDFVQR